eukprot:CAMPEP_0204361278 /NCGR_PEP_ID=MMETSP0469-20131031/38698_1 /ASSEMBLY_ACC=CAM_ASM_000384 /TAXON_ID=2969 /ORGANISM="Oxyrrhis marina" /LENGTH=505 /DNA_ID=CAMNT_0051349651 /DNA_START=8 /DNA_END=1520 /DNA_ORIENTATION=+
MPIRRRQVAQVQPFDPVCPSSAYSVGSESSSPAPRNLASVKSTAGREARSEASGNEANSTSVVAAAGATAMELAASHKTIELAVLSVAMHDVVALSRHLSRGVDVAAVAFKGMTLLHMAVRRDFPDAVDVLLEFEAEVNARAAETQATPLHVAASMPSSSRAIIMALINHGADSRLLDKEGRKPLDVATAPETTRILRVLEIYEPARAGDAAMVEEAMQGKLNVNFVNPKTGTSPLYAAVDGGHAEVVRLLLKAQASPNLAKEGAYVPLFAAALRKNVTLVSMLIEGGADVSHSVSKHTPLSMAVRKGSQVVIAQLLEAGAPVTWSCLNAAVETSNVSLLQTLVAASGKLDGQDDGETLLTARLSKSISKATAAKVEMLLAAKASVTAPGVTGHPLHTLCTVGLWGGKSRDMATRLLNRLLEADAEPNAGGGRSLATPLICLITAAPQPLSEENCSTLCDIARTLVEARADPSLQDSRGNTALLLAERSAVELRRPLLRALAADS